MSTSKLTLDQWSKIRDFLKEETNVYVKSERDCKRFIEGVLWMSRSCIHAHAPYLRHTLNSDNLPPFCKHVSVKVLRRKRELSG